MSTTTCQVCDQCKGVIPTGAQCITGVNATLVLSTTGTQVYVNLDFCCTAHMGAYLQTQPVIPEPSPLYQPVP